jgi:hypothetical protein
MKTITNITSRMRSLCNAVLTRAPHNPDSVDSVLERHDAWLRNGAANQSKWRVQVAENEFEGTCGCRFDKDENRTYWCGDHY